MEKVMKNCPKILQLGSLYFKDSDDLNKQGKPMVRCEDSVDIEQLVREVVHKEWSLRNPKIVVIVLSNCGPIHNWKNKQQIRAFQKGLMNAAENTNMWLITNGIDIGATAIIGDAVHDYTTEIKYKMAINSEKSFAKSNFIGIVNEDNLKYLQTITTSAQPRITITSGGINRSNNSKKKYELQPYLSHYILIKDKSEDKCGVNEFINKFISFLSLNQKHLQSGGGGGGGSGQVLDPDLCSIETSEVPVVSILMNGGYECARLVLNHIRQELPVVVLRGTGGLADLLAFADIETRDRCMNVWNTEFVETYLKPELTLRIGETFGNLRDNRVLLKTFRHRILESIRLSRQPNGQNYMTIINMFDTYSCNLENLTEYLLSALFRSQRNDSTSDTVDDINSETDGQQQQQQQSADRHQMTAEESAALIHKDLQLCIDWNCPEVARSQVLTKDPTYSLNNEKSLFEESLIRSNRWKFVDLFLSQKFKLRSFVRPKTLIQMFRSIHAKDFFQTVCWEAILGRSVDQRQDDSENFLSREFNYLVSVCCGVDRFVTQEELDLFVTEQYPQESEREAERKALEIVVLWAVMDFRKKLVHILWRYSDQPIHLALIIALSYKRMSWFVGGGDQQLCDQLLEESQIFIDYAISVLDLVYKDSAVRAERILVESSRDWNSRTALDLAAFGKFKTFFIHPSCQRRLTNQIYGHIAVREVRIGIFRLPSMFKLLTSAYLVLPAYFWIRVVNNNNSKPDATVFHHQSDDGSANDDNKSPAMKKKMKRPQPPPPPLPKKIPNISEENQRSLSSPPPRPLYKTYQSSTPLMTIMYYTWTAPITKFWNYQFFYTFYLSIFSVAVLYPRCGHFYLDLVVSVWTALIVVDQCRQTYLIGQRNANYYNNKSRVCEMIFQSTFLMYYIRGRLIYWYTTTDAYTEKVMMCLALLHAYYVLFTVFLPISATLGPLLYRLKIMLFVDFLNFIRLSILVMISFGVVLQSLLYPDLSINYELFRRTFHRAFFTLFSNYVRELEVDMNCEENNRWDQQQQQQQDSHHQQQQQQTCTASIYNTEECRVTGLWPYFFGMGYLVLLKVILMTLLSAIFAASAVKHTTDMDSIWKSQRYGLVIDFVTRAPLPPPLNIFYYIYWICRRFCCICYYGYCCCCCCCDKQNKVRLNKTEDHMKLVTDEDYAYLKILATQVYDDKQLKDNEHNLCTKQWEMTKAMSEELEYQRRQLRKLMGRTSEMERSIQQSFVLLESLKHLSTTSRSSSASVSELCRQQKLHVLSRHSPYPGTDVHRYPVPDKYVSWHVLWCDYDPIAYSKPRSEMRPTVRDWTDTNILALKESNFEKPEHLSRKLPVFQWNQQTVSGAGVCIDRQSWHRLNNNQSIIYKLEDNVIPINPFGRTGLRGRGSLLRWGPNHYVMTVITRKKFESLEVMVEVMDPKNNNNNNNNTNNQNNNNNVSLIERFISGDLQYGGIESMFKIDNEKLRNWTKSETMIEWFGSLDEKQGQQSQPSLPPQQQKTFRSEQLMRGYFDDPLNTDNAWKELELWHIHYSHHNININDHMSDSVDWRDVSENLFYCLSLSHSKVIQDIIDKLDVGIRC
ncbi:transient receptor potential cation channel subfamily M member 1-like [Oppia nitens]|uniref:transient receptor potential cation channel subfamily M member 1-like n=1 Tax=Oppia nitens TaxID=1686743 RepID=UPI0023DA985E|nr:transient receptor potential cation channel subfamily M member 1-like [Oppia nitens]